MNAWEEKILDRQEAHEAGVAEGHAQGMSEGHARGLSDGMEKTALRMKEKGFDYEVISEITDLSIQEIKELLSTDK